jgi:hypothetical protein
MGKKGGHGDGWVSRLDRVVEERLPFQSISINVHVLAILVEQREDGPVVARDASQAGKSHR